MLKTKLRIIKPLFGILLIIMAIGLLIFWETAGREALLMEKVLVAKQDIMPGTEVNSRMFKEIGVLNENMIKDGMKASQFHSIEGKISRQIILENSQISKRFFAKKKIEIKRGYAIYQIKPDWIFSVSSSLRKDDIVDIYGMDGETKLGSFTVAFVKDAQGIEVTEGREPEVGGKSKDVRQDGGTEEILERVDGSAVIAELEILATLNSYKSIVDYILENDKRIIIVNRKE